MFNVSALVHVSQQILVSLSMHITSQSEQQNSNYYLIMQYKVITQLKYKSFQFALSLKKV